MNPSIELLYEALNSDYGVVISTNSPERFRQKFYQLRKQDEALACLSCTISPTAPAAEIWIVKNAEE